MKKNFALIILSLVVIIAFFEVRAMSTRASYWMKRCDAAEQVIHQVEDDDPENYYTDGLGDTMVYDEWLRYSNP